MKNLINKKKILFVVDSLGSGGAGRVVAILAEHIAKDYSVYLADFTTDKDCYVNDKSIQVFHLKKQLESNNANFINKSLIIRKLAFESTVDAIVSFGADMNIYASIASMFSPWKLIISVRNNPYISPKKKKLRIMRFLLYRFADGFTFQTEDEKLFFSKKIQYRSIVIENPVAKNIPKPFNGIREKRVVMVGRLNKQKNYPMAIEAFTIFHNWFPEYQLEIYGDGELKDELTELIEQNNMCEFISLMGHSDNIWECIRRAGLYIMTSDYEGMSNALIESMAMGIPTISTDHPIGGAKQLIDDGYNGLLSKVGDAKMFAEKMLYLLENPKLAKNISRNSSKIGKKLSVEIISERWSKYIKGVLIR